MVASLPLVGGPSARRNSSSSERKTIKALNSGSPDVTLSPNGDGAHMHRSFSDSATAPTPLRSLRDFLRRDQQLNEVVALFAQKFFSVSGHANFTLNTLTDMAWTVLVLTRDAVVEGKLSLQDSSKYEDRAAELTARNSELQAQLNECRMAYLQEVGTVRDVKREEIWTPEVQQVYDDLMDRDVFRFVPEKFMDAESRKYFVAAMEESLKVALTRGASAAGGELAKALERIEQLLEDSADLKEKVNSLELERERLKREFDASKSSLGAGSKPKPVDNRQAQKAQAEELEKLKAKLAQVLADKEKLDTLNTQLQSKLISLGVDPNDLDGSGAVQSKDHLQKECDQLQKERDATQHQLDEYKNRSEERSRRIADLERQLAETQEAAKKQAVAMKSLEEKTKSNPTPTEKVTVDHSAVDAAVVDALKQAEISFQTRFDDQEQLIAELKKKLATAGKPGASDKRAEDAEDRARELELKLKMLDAKHAEAQSALEKSRAQFNSMEEKLQAEKLRATTLEQKAAEAVKALNSAKPQVVIQEVKVKGEVEAPKPKKPPPEPTTPSGGAEKKKMDPHGGMSAEEIEAMKAAMAENDKLRKRVAKQEALLKDVAEKEEALRTRLISRTEQLEQSRDKERILQLMLEQLKDKIVDLKQILKAKGVDMTAFDDAFADVGLGDLFLNPVSVFDRLYADAQRRQRSEKKSKQAKFGAGALPSQLGSKYQLPFRQRHQEMLAKKQAAFAGMQHETTDEEEDEEESSLGAWRPRNLDEESDDGMGTEVNQRIGQVSADSSIPERSVTHESRGRSKRAGPMAESHATSRAPRSHHDRCVQCGRDLGCLYCDAGLSMPDSSAGLLISTAPAQHFPITGGQTSVRLRPTQPGGPDLLHAWQMTPGSVYLPAFITPGTGRSSVSAQGGQAGSQQAVPASSTRGRYSVLSTVTPAFPASLHTASSLARPPFPLERSSSPPRAAADQIKIRSQEWSTHASQELDCLFQLAPVDHTSRLTIVDRVMRSPSPEERRREASPVPVAPVGSSSPPVVPKPVAPQHLVPPSLTRRDGSPQQASTSVCEVRFVNVRVASVSRSPRSPPRSRSPVRDPASVRSRSPVSTRTINLAPVAQSALPRQPVADNVTKVCPPGSSVKGEQIVATFEPVAQGTLFVTRPNQAPAMINFSAGANNQQKQQAKPFVTTQNVSPTLPSAPSAPKKRDVSSVPDAKASDGAENGNEKSASQSTTQPPVPLQRRPQTNGDSSGAAVQSATTSGNEKAAAKNFSASNRFASPASSWMPQMSGQQHTQQLVHLPSTNNALPKQSLMQDPKFADVRTLQASRSAPVLPPQKTGKSPGLQSNQRRPGTPTRIVILGRKHEGCEK